jgi:hypothetical protein
MSHVYVVIVCACLCVCVLCTTADLASYCTVLDRPEFQNAFGSCVLTYAPFSLRVVDVLRDQFAQVSCCALHEMTSERDLVGKVNEFFETATDGAIFVVQADPASASLRRIQHARYILENARACFVSGSSSTSAAAAGLPPMAANAVRLPSGGPPVVANDDEEDSKGEPSAATATAAAAAADALTASTKIKGIHVMLLLHLPRAENTFSFDFDHRWRYVFVDSIEPAKNSGLPDLQNMLGSDIASIIAKLDLNAVLLRVFRTSMSRLVYLYQRTTDDVRDQILFILSRLEAKDESFVSICKKLLGELVHESGIALDLFAIAERDHELALAGTTTPTVASTTHISTFYVYYHCNYQFLQLLFLLLLPLLAVATQVLG